MPEQTDSQIYMVLSELFLDTDLTSEDARSLADALRNAQKSIDDSEHKIKRHLFPVLYPNLLGVTGEWAGFNKDWLLREVDNARTKEDNYGYKIWFDILWFLCGRIITSRWEIVKQYLREDKR